MKRECITRTLIGIIGLLVLAGCNGSGSSGSGVDSLAVEPGVLAPGQASVVTVKFSFSSDDVFDEDEDVRVVVQLPSQVRYRPGSSEITRVLDDHSVDPVHVGSCGDGSSFIEYNFNEFDLDDASNPSGDADAELTFTVDAVLTGSATIRGAADNNGVAYACEVPFNGDKSVAVVVQ